MKNVGLVVSAAALISFGCNHGARTPTSPSSDLSSSVAGVSASAPGGSIPSPSPPVGGLFMEIEDGECNATFTNSFSFSVDSEVDTLPHFVSTVTQNNKWTVAKCQLQIPLSLVSGTFPSRAVVVRGFECSIDIDEVNFAATASVATITPVAGGMLVLDGECKAPTPD